MTTAKVVSRYSTGWSHVLAAALPSLVMGTVVSLPDAARKMMLCSEAPSVPVSGVSAAGEVKQGQQPEVAAPAGLMASLSSPGRRLANSIQALSPRRLRRSPGQYNLFITLFITYSFL